jgi:hypothetical protein
LAARPGHSLWDATFAPDDRWVLFNDTVESRARIIVAPISDGQGHVDSASWIPITDQKGWADKPRWSPDGRLVYYVSERDGFRCVWAQRLDPASRRPQGEPFAVHHEHGASLSLRNLLLPNLGLAVARDRLVFNAGAQTGNIWLTRLPRGGS